MLYKPLFHCNSHLNSCSELTRQSASVIKVGVVDVDGVHVSSHLIEELAWAADKQLQVISTIICDLKNNKSTKELKGVKE